jgi:glycerol 2-dehydrogenase (NADP+)
MTKKKTAMFHVLANGLEIPAIGFGTDWIDKAEQCVASVKSAAMAGYRLFDTAYCYNNEQYIGRAVQELVRGG